MDSSSAVFPHRSSPERDVSGNHHSPNDGAPSTEETSIQRRIRPSRACTLKAQQRLQEQQATERRLRPAKKEQHRPKQQRREEFEEEEDEYEDEEEDVDESRRNRPQCEGSTSMIVTSLIGLPEPSQMPRWSLRTMWELSSVLNFLQVFRPLLNINVEFSAEELETALLTPNDTLSNVHIPLLKAIPPITRMALTRDTWVTVLCRKLRDWWHWVSEGDLPIVTSHGLEVEVYKSLEPGIRLLILKALCDIRVEQQDIRGYIDSSLKSGVHLSAFCKERVGGDSRGVNFWYEDDPLIGHRLYREVRQVELIKAKTKGSKVLPNVSYQWETVATNFDEFQNVSEKLFSSKNRAEASLGKKLKNYMLPEIEKEHKKKERLLKKQHRQALLLDSSLVVDGLAAGRSLRDRKPVRYTFDDYDRSINEAIKMTKKKPPSTEPPFPGREGTRSEASANGRWTISTHPSESINNETSPQSPDFGDDDDVDEYNSELLDRSNRRRELSQHYSTMDFVETVSDNEAHFDSDDDIVGEAIYDEEYLKKRKHRKKVSSSSEGDEEYRWDEDNFDDEEEDSLSVSEEDSDEPVRFKKLASHTRREAKLRSRSNDLQPGLRRSKRAARNQIDYKQYELSESDNEKTRPAKSKRLDEQDEHTDGTEEGDFSVGSQESEENGDCPETNVDDQPIVYNNNNTEGTEKESGQLVNKSNGINQDEAEGGTRRFLDLNEVAPVSGFDDGPNPMLKDD